MHESKRELTTVDRVFVIVGFLEQIIISCFLREAQFVIYFYACYVPIRNITSDNIIIHGPFKWLFQLPRDVKNIAIHSDGMFI